MTLPAPRNQLEHPRPDTSGPGAAMQAWSERDGPGLFERLEIKEDAML